MKFICVFAALALLVASASAQNIETEDSVVIRVSDSLFDIPEATTEAIAISDGNAEENLCLVVCPREIKPVCGVEEGSEKVVYFDNDCVRQYAIGCDGIKFIKVDCPEKPQAE